MRTSEYYILAAVVHLALPFLLGSIIGNYISGLFKTDSNVFNYIFIIAFYVISGILVAKSFRNADGKYHNALIMFGKWEGVVPDGLQYLPFGFLKNSVKLAQYTKGVFGIKRTITVEHSNNSNPNQLFQYQMELEYNLNLMLKKDNLKDFFENANEDFLIKNVFDENDKEARQWLVNIVKDINTTLEQIALAFGFEYLKKNNDWTLETLLEAHEKACTHTNSHASHDSLEKTLGKYAIDKEKMNMNTQVRLEKSVEEAMKKKKINEITGEANIAAAKKAKEVKIIEANATAESETVLAAKRKEIIEDLSSKIAGLSAYQGLSSRDIKDMVEAAMGTYDSENKEHKIHDIRGLESLTESIEKVFGLFKAKTS